jgi:hypothetical protein
MTEPIEEEIIIKDLLRSLSDIHLECNGLHHTKADRHGILDKCPVLERIESTRARAEAVITPVKRNKKAPSVSRGRSK